MTHRPKHRPPPESVKPERPRVFDHLSDEPEAKRFREIAQEMRRAPTWSTPNERDEPEAVSGELADMDGMMAQLHAFIDSKSKGRP